MPAPPPPTAEQWEFHRPEICKLYRHRPLKAIRAYMLERYGFNATDRMYKGRFKVWGVEKNRRHRRDSQPRQEIQPSPPLSPPSPHLDSLDAMRRELPQQSNPGSIIASRDGSPHFNDPESDSRSATYIATPSTFPLTPVTLRDRSPTIIPEAEDEILDPDAIRKQIVASAISILRKLPLRQPGSPAVEPNGDHVEIFQSLQTKLRHEGKLRGCLVNRQQAVPKTLMAEIVKDMLSPLYPAAPIGVLSIFNQLLDWMVINELADCLVESAQSILPPDDDFTRLALAMRRLLVITDLKTFSHTMAKVCDDLEQGILVVLGKQSLVRVYLVFLLNAQKAKSKHQKDNKVLSMALERFAHVQHAYKDNAKLILEFNLFVVGYLSIVTPGAPDVASMASACYTRATEYLTDRENFGSEVEIRNAKFHLGKSCAYLADCRYAVGQENKDEEQCSSARGMLLVAIGHHADCAEATFAHVGRQMEKLAKWCKEANDTERLDHLNLIYGMIEGKEQRPKGEPLLPRLRS